MPLSPRVIKTRNKIIKDNSFKLLKVFDTNKHEDNKDVVLVYDPVDKKKKVLRVGEHRTTNFLYVGYIGKKIIIPKIYKINTDLKNKYEIEEFIPGKLICDLSGKSTATKLIPKQYFDLMIDSFWEFQKVASSIQIPRHEVYNAKVQKHFKEAVKLMDDPNRIKRLINSQKIKKFFQDNNYPCKWKFAVDNLIITPDKKLGFIDLANVSRRFWGYDLGWIFWAVWFQLSIQDYKQIDKHFLYLENIFKKVNVKAPKDNKIDIIYVGYILILERIVGALYDLSANISHAQKINKQNKKQQAFINFLNGLLNLTATKLESYI
mgnify:CR=1 FL=1